MNATVDRHGNVTITFNVQSDQIAAPSDEHGAIYLPCEAGCGRLLVVRKNVVSTACGTCLAKAEDPQPEQGPLNGHAYFCPGCCEADCVCGYGEWEALNAADESAS